MLLKANSLVFIGKDIKKYPPPAKFLVENNKKIEVSRLNQQSNCLPSRFKADFPVTEKTNVLIGIVYSMYVFLNLANVSLDTPKWLQILPTCSPCPSIAAISSRFSISIFNFV